jgi:hypothetical protein
MKTIATIYLLVLSLMSPASIVESKATITYFDDIRLTPENEIAPFVGAEYTFGLAKVSVEYDASKSKVWRVCITTHIEGFIPGQLRIRHGEIFENGDIVVDFTSLLTDHHSAFYGCRGISKTLYNKMISEPVSCSVHWKTFRFHLDNSRLLAAVSNALVLHRVPHCQLTHILASSGEVLCKRSRWCQSRRAFRAGDPWATRAKVHCRSHWLQQCYSV